MSAELVRERSAAAGRSGLEQQAALSRWHAYE
jgi:hypothetical protein